MALLQFVPNEIDWLETMWEVFGIAGAAFWAVILFNSVIDRWAIMTGKRDGEMRILSDIEILIAMAGGLGFVGFAIAGFGALATPNQTPMTLGFSWAVVIRVSLILSEVCFCAIGATWLWGRHRFNRYISTPNKRKTDPHDQPK